MGTPQKLGIKVFYYYLFKRILAGLLLFIIALVLSSLKDVIVSKIFFLLPFSLSVVIVYYFIVGLFLISILLIAGGFIVSWLLYISCTFTLDEQSFNIRRGIFNKKEVSIPYRQVQDIDIEQTFYHKIMGVSKLVVLTAGNDDKDKEGEAEGIFQVIDSNMAENLRKDILGRTNVQRVQEVKS